MSREEYLTRKGQAEREIQYWEKRTTETQQVALELAMCVEAIQKVAQMWELADNEDRRGLLHSLFDSISFDLDTRRIVDFRLKPWAERFLMVRGALYEMEENEAMKGSEKDPDEDQGDDTNVAPTGVRGQTFILVA